MVLGQNPARRLAGGEGPVGEEGEELDSNLWMALGGFEAVGRGGAVANRRGRH